MTPVHLHVVAYFTKYLQGKQKEGRKDTRRLKPKFYGEVLTRDEIIERMEEEKRKKGQKKGKKSTPEPDPEPEPDQEADQEEDEEADQEEDQEADEEADSDSDATNKDENTSGLWWGVQRR